MGLPRTMFDPCSRLECIRFNCEEPFRKSSAPPRQDPLKSQGTVVAFNPDAVLTMLTPTPCAALPG